MIASEEETLSYDCPGAAREKEGFALAVLTMYNDYGKGRRMVTKIAEKTVVMTQDGTALSVMERPGGLGSIEDFHKELVEVRKQYGHLLKQQSLDEYLSERRIAAEREWK